MRQAFAQASHRVAAGAAASLRGNLRWPAVPYAICLREAESLGEGLTASKMTVCRRLDPFLVSRIELLKWTPEDRMRHVRFAGIRSDKIGPPCFGNKSLSLPGSGASQSWQGLHHVADFDQTFFVTNTPTLAVGGPPSSRGK